MKLMISRSAAMAFASLFICVLASVPQKGEAIDKSIQRGDWNFTFDEKSGIWKGLSWKNRPLSLNAEGIPPLSVGGREKAISSKPGDWTLRDYDWNDAEGMLTLDYNVGSFALSETLRFSPGGASGLLALTSSVTYLPKDSKEPLALENVCYNIPLPGSDGRVYLPARSKNSGIDIKSLNASVGQQGETGSSLLVELKRDLSILFFPDCRREWHYCRLDKGENAFLAQVICQGGGWFYPGERQDFGTVYIKCLEKPIQEAFRGGIWELHGQIGYSIPTGRPTWMEDIVAIADFTWKDLHASYTSEGNICAGQRELLPRLRSLGFDAIWAMPAWPEQDYHPQDYYAVDQRNGSVDDLKSFVKEAQKDGFRVFLDIVPHGGNPIFGKERGDKPWWLIFDKNGDAQSYWCFDFANPEWQAKIYDVAKFLMETYRPDALRIDAPTGSNNANWRKKDFPSIDKVPANVPADWWKAELSKVGGKLPPMPYARASLSRQAFGGNGMTSVIRRAVKEASPAEGGVLAEVQRSFNGTVADMIYDSSWFTNFIPEALPSDSPETFAARISVWLEEQKFNDIKGMIRMRCMNYGSCMLTGDWGGVDAINAVQAVNFFASGVPTVNVARLSGYGVLLEKLTGVRKALPEFRRGDAEYLDLGTDRKGVFSVIRELGDQVSAGFVSFSPEVKTLKLKIPAKYFKFGNIDIYDVWNGAKIASGMKDGVGSVSLTLRPFGISVLTFRKAGEASPELVTSKIVETPKSEGKLSCEFSRWNSPTVRTTAYVAKFKGSGMLYDLRDSAGTRLIDANSILSENFLGITSEAKGSVKLRNSDDSHIELESLMDYEGAKIELIWNCRKDSLTLSAKLLSVPEKSENLGYLLSLGKAVRWQVSTAEGLLDDHYMPGNLFGKPESHPARNLRCEGSPIVWTSQTRPLSPVRPVIAAFQENGSGVTLELLSPFDSGLDDVLFLDKQGNLFNPHLAFMWREPLKPFPMPSHSNAFSVKISPTRTPLVPEMEKRECAFGDLKFFNASRGWHLENKHYKLDLRRTGGSIRDLSLAEGQQVLGNVDIFAASGFAPDKAWDAYGQRDSLYNSGNDIETSSRIWREDGKLRLRFYGALRVYAASLLRMNKPVVRYIVDYSFDESPKIGIEMSVLYDSVPGDNPQLGVNCRLPAGLLAKATEGGLAVAKDGSAVLALLNIKGASSLEISKGGVGLMFLNKGKGRIQPDKWQTISFQIETTSTERR